MALYSVQPQRLQHIYCAHVNRKQYLYCLNSHNLQFLCCIFSFVSGVEPGSHQKRHCALPNTIHFSIERLSWPRTRLVDRLAYQAAHSALRWFKHLSCEGAFKSTASILPCLFSSITGLELRRGLFLSNRVQRRRSRPLERSVRLLA